MATKDLETSAISLIKPLLHASDISYLAAALEVTEVDPFTLLTAPTTELANKYAASASTKPRASDKLDSGKENDTTERSQPFPFMALPPELRLQIYKTVFEDTFIDTVHKRPSDEIPRSGIRPRVSHRSALRRHIKTTMAILRTCRTVRAEGTSIAFQIADTHVKSTLLSLKQLGAECKLYDHGNAGRDEMFADDCIPARYAELLRRYADLCVVRDALRLVKEDLSKSRPRESFEGRVDG